MTKKKHKHTFHLTNSNYVVTPPTKGLNLGLRELLKYRKLVWVMMWREILVRYKQTYIGAAWVLIQPIITTIVFVIIFNRMMNVQSNEVPYVAFALSGIICWVYFTHAVTKSSICLLTNRILLKKVYFSRLTLPVSVILGGLLDFFIAFVVLVVVLIIYQIPIGLHFLFFPFFLFLLVLNALAVGLWLSSINVKYRDVKNMLPFLLQIGLFITPIGYPLALAPEKWKLFFILNPLSGAIAGFRWSILGTEFPSWLVLGTSIGVTFILLVSGLLFFKKQEPYFSDLL